MKLCTTTGLLASRFGDEEALRMLAEAGFDCVDYSLFDYGLTDSFWDEATFSARMARLKETGDRLGIGFYQLHAPFPSDAADPEMDKLIRTRLLQSIDAAGLLGCPYVVIHPIIDPECKYDRGHEKNLERNLDLYRNLIPRARKRGVAIGLENMFAYDPETDRMCPTVCSTAREMNEYMDLLGDTCVACLDTGHAVLTHDGPAAMARALGKRLKLLHVHGNDGRTDLHQPPFLHEADWPDFMAALREIGYDGALSLEADSFLYHLPNELLPQGLAFLRATAAHLATL